MGKTRPIADALVNQLGAGGYPPPVLLEAILAEGEAAVAPLLALLRRNVRARTAERLALLLLARLGAAAVLPHLLQRLDERRFPEDVLVDAFLDLGPASWPPLRALLAQAPGYYLTAFDAEDQGCWVAVNLALRYPDLRPEIDGTLSGILKRIMEEYPTADAARQDDLLSSLDMLVVTLIPYLLGESSELGVLLDEAKEIDPEMLDYFEAVIFDIIYCHFGGRTRVAWRHERDWLANYREQYAAARERG